jgi:HEAT repeat protein
MAVQWFCPECFAQVDQRSTRCPRCGVDLSHRRRDYEADLIKALRHPLADRRLVAAQILGARRSRRAVAALIDAVAASDSDPYLAAEAVVALGLIEDPRGLEVVRQAAEHGPVVPRAAARQTLDATMRRPGPQPRAGTVAAG